MNKTERRKLLERALDRGPQPKKQFEAEIDKAILYGFDQGDLDFKIDHNNELVILMTHKGGIH